MLIKNTQADALPSSLTPEDLGKAMAQLDLSTVPSHKRAAAIQDHLMKIIANSIHDRTVATDIHVSRLLRHAREHA